MDQWTNEWTNEWTNGPNRRVKAPLNVVVVYIDYGLCEVVKDQTMLMLNKYMVGRGAS